MLFKRRLEKDGNANAKCVRSQGKSPLFRLPYEVREMIYHYAFTGHSVHIWQEPFEEDRLTHIVYTDWGLARKFRPRLILNQNPGGYNQARRISYPTHVDRQLNMKTLRPLSFIAPLLVCWRMHHEVIPFIYSENTFTFFDLGSLYSFANRAADAALPCVKSVYVSVVGSTENQYSFEARRTSTAGMVATRLDYRHGMVRPMQSTNVRLTPYLSTSYRHLRELSQEIVIY